MKASRSSRIAALAACAAAFAAASAQAAAPAYPAYPTSYALPDVAAWLRANTNVELGAVVGVGADSVFALEPTREGAAPPAVRATIRQEVINPTFATSLGGRSAVMVADIDCDGRRVFQRALDLYAGNNRQGAVRRLGAANDWQAVPPGTFMDDVVAAVCERDYHPIFPGGQVAQAARPPGPVAFAVPRRAAAPSPPIRYIAPSRAPARAAPTPAAAPPPPAAPGPVATAPVRIPSPAPAAVALAPVSPDGPIATQPFTRPIVIAPSVGPATAASTAAPVVTTRAATVASAPIAQAAAPTATVRPPAPPAAAPPIAAAAPPPRPAPPRVAPPQAAPPRVAAAAPARPPQRPAPTATALGLRPLVLGRADIGAYPSVDAAIAAWRAIAAAHPAAMAGKRQRIELYTAGGATRFRAFVDGFPGRGDAEAFCRPIVAQGGACRAAE